MAALKLLRRGEDADEEEAAAAQGGGQEADRKPAVALIMAVGQIVSGKGSATDLQPMREIASTPMCAQLRAARFDPQIKAVVLRIDTPGAPVVRIVSHDPCRKTPRPERMCTCTRALHLFPRELHPCTSLPARNPQVATHASNGPPD